ncbi:uncharacterized protein Ecym_2679 [Eremothecium cymbalariae DBVPG|uniref:Major facilitator superfamily (MFS) profile domain-containing protein n=1 Tax=Eremothecium cymbalariae (strain CBS 270.75 / DBVPG 7215 / KCTC 17166 / NRRL Y-17582) TaxID=931890 RepID=G8JNW4_ERECY|nr:Hypothetical protein Ecym_2679 [Eremothecium cymbalariae DBVPG\
MSMMKLDFTVVPGDSYLVQRSVEDEDKNKVVLNPTPSDDPDDPLNWEFRRKWLAVVCVLAYTLGVVVPTAAIYSVLTSIEQSTDISLEKLNHGTGYMFLFLGLGGLVFQPLALQYGKRPVYLFSMLSTAAICLWPSFIKTNDMWIVSKILQGFVGSPIESLPEITMSDLFFEHERSLGLSLYALMLLVGSYLAPAVSGFVSDSESWRWVMWGCAVLDVFCFIFLFFFMEETNYNRVLKINGKTNRLIIPAIHQNNSNVVIQLCTAGRSDGSLSSEEQKEPIAATNLEQPNGFAVFNQASDVVVVSSDYEPKYTSKSFYSKLSLISGKKPKFLLHQYFIMPFLMCRFPIVLWAGFLYGTSLISFNVMNATGALILTGVPYNFETNIFGLAYISPTIFSLILFYISGYFSDQLKIRIAVWRGGKSLAEDRLWVLIPYVLLGFFACILWGVGAEHKIHWSGLVIAMGILGGCGIFGIVTSTTYIVDCYKELATEAMVVVILIRNLMSFGISYGITSWVQNMGYKKCFIALAFISLVCNSSFILMAKVGPWCRNKQKQTYWETVQRCRNLGMH